MFLTTMELTSVDGGGGTAAPNPDIGGSWDPRRYEHIYTTRGPGVGHAFALQKFGNYATSHTVAPQISPQPARP